MITVCDVSKDEPWLSDITSNAHKHLRNQVTPTSRHFNNTGKVYSFGLHSLFETKENSATVGLYKMKKENPDIDFHTNVKNSCVSNLQKGIESLCKFDDLLHRIIAPVCTSLSPKLKKSLGIDSTFQNASYPFMSAHLNVNVQVGLPHIEHDM